MHFHWQLQNGGIQKQLDHVVYEQGPTILQTGMGQLARVCNGLPNVLLLRWFKPEQHKETLLDWMSWLSCRVQKRYHVLDLNYFCIPPFCSCQWKWPTILQLQMELVKTKKFPCFFENCAQFLKCLSWSCPIPGNCPNQSRSKTRCHSSGVCVAVSSATLTPSPTNPTISRNAM